MNPKLYFGEHNFSYTLFVAELLLETICIALIGTLIGLVLSVLYFVLRFLFNKHFINDKEVEMFLGVDVLAEIPMEK